VPRRDPVEEQGLCQMCAMSTWQVERVRKSPGGGRPLESVPEVVRLCGGCFAEDCILSQQYEGEKSG
jgi:hypothetical protein